MDTRADAQARKGKNVISSTLGRGHAMSKKRNWFDNTEQRDHDSVNYPYTCSLMEGLNNKVP